MTNNAKIQATDCRVRATLARQQADAATSPEQRAAWIDVANHWAELAQTYDMVAKLNLAAHGKAA